MYKSVIRDGKFLVLVVDGIFDTPLMELPTEELADKVAFELQSAWEDGIERGSNQKQSDLLGTGGDTEITSNLQKLQAMSAEERDAYHQRVDRRNERIEKVAEARRWRNVLSWKEHN
ncbi:hypothetical protein [Paenibacillus piri]|uniref:Uncharacterized protein n=1 Tax=Paenibacillus piri TaxID=2547395 RepID=A0A4R5KIW9_9BACL|nr:hypothetical protein [Paenibacillus piri]TDF95469.1 hypothetical protein E1757_20385 [Paenibacillus piri]